MVKKILSMLIKENVGGTVERMELRKIIMSSQDKSNRNQRIRNQLIIIIRVLQPTTRKPATHRLPHVVDAVVDEVVFVAGFVVDVVVGLTVVVEVAVVVFVVASVVA